MSIVLIEEIPHNRKLKTSKLCFFDIKVGTSKKFTVKSEWKAILIPSMKIAYICYEKGAIMKIKNFTDRQFEIITIDGCRKVSKEKLIKYFSGSFTVLSHR